MNIIATIGPSSNSRDILEQIIKAGAQGIRLNFSHFNEKEFAEVFDILQDRKIAIIADMSGGKVRVHEDILRTMKIIEGEIIYFCSIDNYKELIKKQGTFKKIIPLNIKAEVFQKNNIEEISMKDNTMLFEVIDKNKETLKVRVKNTGIVRGGKGCNIKNLHRGVATLSEKDKKNIIWAINHRADIICQSYVEDSAEINEIRCFIKNVYGNETAVKILAKIETSKGVENIEKIAKEADGIVIGRGDLTAECGLEEAVLKQNKIVKNLRNIDYNKSVIIATHLFDNMINRDTALYTEVECIFNFMGKGISGLMLTGETSIGRKPVEVVKYLNELIKLYKL